MAEPSADSPNPAPQPVEGPTPATGPTPVTMRWWVIVLFGLWSVFVWSTRTVNIWRDLLLSTDEKVVLTVMAAIFVVLGLAVALIGLGLRRWAPSRVDIVTVGVLGGWTCGVWFLRIVEMVADGDHGAAFILVHVVLAAISIALAAWSWRELAAVRPLVFGASSADEPEDEDVPLEGSAEDEGELEAGSVVSEARQ
jgi:hypothetical protein